MKYFHILNNKKFNFVLMNDFGYSSVKIFLILIYLLTFLFFGSPPTTDIIYF